MKFNWERMMIMIVRKIVMLMIIHNDNDDDDDDDDDAVELGMSLHQLQDTLDRQIDRETSMKRRNNSNDILSYCKRCTDIST